MRPPGLPSRTPNNGTAVGVVEKGGVASVDLGPSVRRWHSKGWVQPPSSTAWDAYTLVKAGKGTAVEHLGSIGKIKGNGWKSEEVKWSI